MDPFADFWGPPKSSGPLTALLGGQLPAGMRNNNPGNIKYFKGLSYPGMVGPSQNRDQGDPQMVFDTPQSGMNAASQLALKKYSGGKRTANDLIAGNMGWTPGNTSAAANIARTMGVSPSDDLQLSDPNRMRSFLKALTFQEQGAPSKAYGDDVYGGAGATPAPTQERAQMPMPRQPGLMSAMGGMSNSMVPGIMGGGDEPGYFGKLLSDPTFLTGASVLGGGLAGQDFGTALGRGAQGAQAQSEMFDKRRKAAAWQKIFPTNGPPDMSSPMLKGLPPDVVPLVAQMGPDEGMKALTQLAFKRMAPRQLTPVSPGASLYDEQAGKEVFRAPAADKFPAGYQAAPDGNGMAYVPGGPADPALKVKEVQYSEGASKAANFGNMMAEAETALGGMTKKGPDNKPILGPDGKPLPLENPLGAGGTFRESMLPEGAANAVRSPEYQNYRQAAMQWVRAKLRKESGAAISPSEFEGEFQTYFPQYGDDVGVRQQKQRAREQAQLGMIAESRGAYEQLFGQRKPQQQMSPGMQPPPGPQGGPVPQPGGNSSITATGPGAPAAPQGSPAPPQAVQMLQSDPSPQAMQEFDQIFGPGAAQRALGR